MARPTSPPPRGRWRRRIGSLLFLAVLLAMAALLRHGRDTSNLIDAQGRGVLVADGDTLRIDRQVIRLAGVDAVERKQFCKDANGVAWSCGVSATAAMQEFVARGGLSCVALDRDRWGRTIARCAVKDVPDIGGAMVAAGWAVNEGDRKTGIYAAAERKAHMERRGIWVGSFDRPRAWRDANRVKPKPV